MSFSANSVHIWFVQSSQTTPHNSQKQTRVERRQGPRAMDGTLPSLVSVKFLVSMDFVHLAGLSSSEGITGGEVRCPAVKKEPSLKLPALRSGNHPTRARRTNDVNRLSIPVSIIVIEPVPCCDRMKAHDSPMSVR